MKISINKDFEDAFPNEFIAGFTVKQCVTAAIGLVLAAAVAVFLWMHTGLGIVECTYIGIPIMIPCCGLGFYKFQGHSPCQMLKEVKYMRDTKVLLFEAEEAGRIKQRLFTTKRTENRYKNGRRRKRRGSN